MAPAPMAGLRRAAVLVAALALLGTGIAPAHADEPDLTPLSPAPAASEATGDEAGSAFAASPPEGSAAAFLADAVDADAPAEAPSAARSAEAAVGTGSISGRITYWSKGASRGGLSTGEAWAYRLDSGSGQWAYAGSDLTDATGAFTITGLDAGTYIVLASDTAVGSWLVPEFWGDSWWLDEAIQITLADGQAYTGVVEELEPIVKERIAGNDRYETAVYTSEAAFPEDVPCAFVATGTNFPDALSAGPAAAHCGGPLLLVPGTTVPPLVLAELKRLSPDRIVIAGSSAVVSTGVENTLKSIAPVTRYAGTDRYDTSRKIVAGEFGTAPAAWVATGANFPDALSASGAAAASDLPVLIVPGTASSLDTASASALTKLGAREVAIAGSAAVVSNGIQTSIGKLSTAPVTYRLAGPDRYSTALAIVDFTWSEAYSYYGFSASGSNFPDALAGAPLAGYVGAPLYITSEACTSRGVQDHIRYLEIAEFFVLGKYQPLYYNTWDPFRSC